MNPALLWQVCFEEDPWFPLDMLEQLINRAIGRFEDLRDDPLPARSSVSVDRFSAVGFVTGVAVTAMGGLIAAGVAYWLGWVG